MGGERPIASSTCKRPHEDVEKAPETMVKQNAVKRCLGALSQRQCLHAVVMDHFYSIFHETDARLVHSSSFARSRRNASFARGALAAYKGKSHCFPSRQLTIRAFHFSVSCINRPFVVKFTDDPLKMAH